MIELRVKGDELMKIETGYLYHIKDEFFDVVNDENLMSNHECGKKRPTYFTIKDKEILWFIPLSSKVEKYIDHVHVLENGAPAKVIDSICDEIFNNFLKC